MEAGYNHAQVGGCVMLRKVRLYGQLAEFVGRKVIEADLSSAAEAVRMLIANFPELDRHMADQNYKVLVGDGALTLDDLHNPVGQEEIKIVPVVVGAGGDAGRILFGAALIGLSFVTFGGGFLGGTGLGTSAQGLVTTATTTGIYASAGSAALGVIGAGLVLSGVANIISPVPGLPQGPDTEQDPRKSFSFSGIQNTSRGGTPVPIVYGKTLTGSVVISAGIDTEQVQV
jgi:predicted phage tail protein